jgi:hypothetical protein
MHTPSSGCRYGDMPPGVLTAPLFFLNGSGSAVPIGGSHSGKVT